MKTKLKVGIVGASGYSGELLVKLLAGHPCVKLEVITSRKLAGTRAQKAIPGLYNCSLTFIDSDAEKLSAIEDIDLWFLALPHGVAAEFAQPFIKKGKRVIDLSADFRLGCAQTYKDFYGVTHPDISLLNDAFYVIPEIQLDHTWKRAQLIACPGCYPTSILIPLIPLLRDQVICNEGIVIHSLSGISGAGKQATEAFSFCKRTESAVAYGIPKHRHLSEVEEQLSLAAGKPTVVQFNPHLVPMKRGIVTTITVQGQNLETLYKSWERAYAHCPFIHILDSGTFPDSAHVIGSNALDMSAVYDIRTGNFVITSAEDNLMKGASGQAVQIMNLWLGFEETCGLV
jgi:N-acetyl-gamma-glutamyl-phosphate reductase